MTDHDDVKNRFAQAIKARREEAAATQASRAEETDRIFAPITARVRALQDGLDGLDGLSDPDQRINQNVKGPNNAGNYTIEILMDRAGSYQTIDVEFAPDAGGRDRLWVSGLSSPAAAKLSQGTRSPYGGKMALDPEHVEALCDAIEGTAEDYFAEA